MVWSHTKIPAGGGVDVPELPEEYYWGVFSEKAGNKIIYTLNLMLKSTHNKSFIGRLLNKDVTLMKHELKSLDHQFNHQSDTEENSEPPFNVEVAALSQAMFKTFFKLKG